MILRNFLKSMLFLAVFALFNKPILAQHNPDSLAYYLNRIKQKKDIYPVDSMAFIYHKARSFASVYDQIVLLRKEAKMLSDQGYQNGAYNRLLQAQSLANKHQYPVAQILVKNSLSYYYFHFNQFVQAYQMLLESKNKFEKLTDQQINNYNQHNRIKFTKEEIYHTLISNMGVLALRNGDLEKAEDFFNQSLRYCAQQQDSVGIIDAKINLACLLYDKKDHLKSIASFNEIGNIPGLSKENKSLVHYNLAMSYFELDSLQQANGSIDKAILYSQEINDRVSLIDLFFLKSQIENRLGNYDSQKKYLNQSIAIAQSIHDSEGSLQAYKELAELEATTGHAGKALVWYRKIQKLQDSLLQNTNSNSIQKIEAENKLVLQQQENEHQTAVINNAKAKMQLMVIILILTVLLSILLFALWLYQKKNTYKQQQIQIQQEKIKEIEMQNTARLHKIESERMQEEVNAKKRELLMSLLFVKKRKEKVKSIHNEIEKIAHRSVIHKEHLMALKDFVYQKSKELDEEENVQQQLVTTHKDFFNQLLKDYPDLSKTELKILAYLRIGLTTKEIADVQYVSIDAVRKTRYRIRKKIHLDASDSLEKFILRYH